MLIEPAGRAPHPDGARDDLAEIDRLTDEGHPAGRDAAHLEKVVDETGEMLALPADHAVRLLGRRRIGLRDVEQGDSARDGAQRVSQLVSEHRQELVLRPVRPLGLRLGGCAASDRSWMVSAAAIRALLTLRTSLRCDRVTSGRCP